MQMLLKTLNFIAKISRQGDRVYIQIPVEHRDLALKQFKGKYVDVTIVERIENNKK